ncbi:HNH endonuclease [Streptomyces coelicoflavus]|uniref:HNH endonuclease n=1 Tax=Streptomyces coelicoflavus TaxID=285562 RepID=UPI003249D3B4
MSNPRPARLRGSRGRRIRVKVGARDGIRCFHCRTPFASTDDATLDHYLPRSLWPIHCQWNLVLACARCNAHKGSTLPLGLLLVLRPWLTAAQLEVAA